MMNNKTERAVILTGDVQAQHNQALANRYLYQCEIERLEQRQCWFNAVVGGAGALLAVFGLAGMIQ
jgi:hypothetical protein